VLATAALVLLASCVRVKVSRSADAATARERIAAVAREFSARYVRGDAAGMATLYTDDGVILPPGRPAITGRDSIASYWRRSPGQRITSHRTVSDSIVVIDSVAYDWGTYTVAGERNGDAFSGGGKYVIVWREVENGVWRMHLDMWNAGPPRTP
jgi:uncharacterized protein (TIGR02246 family)